MTESRSFPASFSAKWIRRSTALYLLFYVLPVLIADTTLCYAGIYRGADFFFATWSFAGVFLIGVLIGYLSRGTAFWEAAAGISILVVLLTTGIALFLFSTPSGRDLSVVTFIIPTLIIIPILSLLSLAGAWIGKRLSHFGRHTHPPLSWQ